MAGARAGGRGARQGAVGRLAAVGRGRRGGAAGTSSAGGGPAGGAGGGTGGLRAAPRAGVPIPVAVRGRRSLKGLRFISRVEERFNALATDGLLARDDFGDYIGMVKSKEFAVGIFHALARRRRQNMQWISKAELYDFWLQISDQSFDARLQIFFNMLDINVDGRMTREELQKAQS